MKIFKLNRGYNGNADLKITLKPTYRCNQMCSFCNEYNNDFPEWSLETIDILYKKLKDIPERYKKIFIYYYGGEPTLFKHLEYLTESIFKSLGDRNVFIQCQTNGSISLDRIRKFKYDNFEFCLSYHLNKQKVETFIEKIKLLEELNILGYVFINTYRGAEAQFLKEFDILRKIIPNKLKMRFTFLPADAETDYEYFIKKYPFMNEMCEEQFEFNVDGKIIGYDEFYNKKLNKFRNMKCECSNKSLVINWDETVFYCDDETRILLSNENNNYLKLKDLDLKNYFKPFKICKEEYCHRGLEFSKYSLTYKI